MICFGAKTDQEVKEKGHVDPTLKLKKQNKKQNKNRRRQERERGAGPFSFIFFIFIFSRFSLRYTEIGPSEFVGARTKRLYSTGATHGNQKHGISSNFQLKNSENPIFWFFSDLRLSDGQNWSEQKVKLIHALRATRGYQNIGVSSNSMRYEFSYKYVNYTYTNSK